MDDYFDDDIGDDELMLAADEALNATSSTPVSYTHLTLPTTEE